MKKVIILLVVFGIYGSNFAQQPIVLELFTSQGCSSCPSADKLLKEISENTTHYIIPLAYHVDYWNRLGWEDPFSKSDFTKYQQQYGLKFGGRSIYTPQLVIQGEKHFVGSDRRTLLTEINNYQGKSLPHSVQIKTVFRKGSNIHVVYSAEFVENSSLNIVMTLNEKMTEVKRGENRNRVLTDAHIVLEKITVSPSNTATEVVFYNVAYDLIELGFVAFLQNRKLELIGATKW